MKICTVSTFLHCPLFIISLRLCGVSAIYVPVNEKRWHNRASCRGIKTVRIVRVKTEISRLILTEFITFTFTLIDFADAFIQNNLLMRKYKQSNISSGEQCNIIFIINVIKPTMHHFWIIILCIRLWVLCELSVALRMCNTVILMFYLGHYVRCKICKWQMDDKL